MQPQPPWKALKVVLDDLLDAHEAFDLAASRGDLEDVSRANVQIESALRRAREVRQEFACAAHDALWPKVLSEPDLLELEKRSHLE